MLHTAVLQACLWLEMQSVSAQVSVELGAEVGGDFEDSFREEGRWDWYKVEPGERLRVDAVDRWK